TAPNIAAPETDWPVRSEHAEFDPLPSEIEEALIKSVTLNEPFSAETEFIEVGGEEEQADFWKGASMRWEANLKRVQLSFGKKADKAAVPPADELLNISVIFEEEALVVKLDKSKYRKFNSGMRFPLKK